MNPDSLFHAAGKATSLAQLAEDVETQRSLYLEAIAAYERILSTPRPPRVGDCLEELAKLYLSIEEFEVARFYAKKALEFIALEATPTHTLSNEQLERITRMYVLLGDLDKQEKSFTTAIAFYEWAYDAAEHTEKMDYVVLAKERLAIACMFDSQNERAKKLFFEIMKEAKCVKDTAWGKRVGEESLRFFLSLDEETEQQKQCTPQQ